MKLLYLSGFYWQIKNQVMPSKFTTFYHPPRGIMILSLFCVCSFPRVLHRGVWKQALLCYIDNKLKGGVQWVVEVQV